MYKITISDKPKPLTGQFHGNRSEACRDAKDFYSYVLKVPRSKIKIIQIENC